MVVRPPPQRPVILPVGLGNGKVVDAGDVTPHNSVLVEFPVLVAVRPALHLCPILKQLLAETNPELALLRPG
jgi:hypothetical protein